MDRDGRFAKNDQLDLVSWRIQVDRLGSEELWRQSESVIKELDLEYSLLRVTQLTCV